jgi:hypothetical protein
MNRFQHSLLALVTAMLMSACGERALETLRKVTYPPDFHYVSPKALRTTMEQLAWYTQLLQKNLDHAEITADQRLRTVQILNKMDQLASKLGASNLRSNHRQVGENIDGFRRDVRKARQDVLRDPPDFNRARAVPGYCLRCHALGKER